MIFMSQLPVLRRRGEKAVLATIVSTSGSAPRKESAKMLVLTNGKIIGTIGGGAIEYSGVSRGTETDRWK